MAFILNRDKGQRMWGGGNSTFNSSRQGGGGSGAGGGGGVSSSWVDDNYVSKNYFNQLFKVKVAVRVVVTDPSTTPATVVSDTITPRQELLYPNEVPEPTETTDEETGYVTSTTYPIDSIQVMGGLWTNSYLSALGQNSSGGGGGGGSTTLYGLLDVNIPAALTQANDGQVLMYNFAQNKWINATIQQSGGTVTSITAGTGLSGGTITTSGTIAINSTYQAYISHGETAYGWGNHAIAGYMTQSAGDSRYLKIDFFRSLFRAYTSGNTEVTPNAGDTATIDNIKAMFGFWTNAYISALGQNSSGGGGGGGSSTLAGLNDVQLGTLSADDILTYDGTGHWINTSKSSFLSGYATTSDISDMATKTWVGLQGYLTSVAFSDLTSHPTTLSGYGITDAVNSSTTWWGQSVSNGAVSGNLTNVGNITSSTAGSIINFNAIEFAATGTAESGNGGALYFHFPGVSGYSSAYILEEEEGVIALHGKLKIGSAYIEWDSTNSCLKISSGLYSNSFISALGLNSSGGGGGGSSTLAGLNDVQLGTLSADDILIYDGTGHWINTSKSSFLSGYVTTSDISDMATKTWVGLQGYTTNAGTVTSITAGTGLSGGTITGSGTIAIDSTYQTYISHGETAYGWGNHAQAGYLTGINATMINDALGFTLRGTASTVYDLSTISTYANHGETAYGWGNHADADYWKSSNHPTTLSGYGISDAVNSSTTFWGQSVSNGVVSGSLTSVGNITSNTNGSIYGFSAIEFGTDSNSGNGGALYFHFPGVVGHASSYIIEQSEGVLSLLGAPPAGENFGVVVGDANGTYLQIGDIRLVYDSTNNALKVQKSDGTAGNFYATGGVSALGMSAGTSSVDAMTFNYVTINTRLTLPSGIIAGTSPMITRQSGDSDCVYLFYDNATSKISSSSYYYNQYDNVGLRGTNYNFDEQWWIDPDGCARFQRLYLDATRYLYVSSGTLYYYNGTTSKQVAFTN